METPAPDDRQVHAPDWNSSAPLAFEIAAGSYRSLVTLLSADPRSHRTAWQNRRHHDPPAAGDRDARGVRLPHPAGQPAERLVRPVAGPDRPLGGAARGSTPAAGSSSAAGSTPGSRTSLRGAGALLFPRLPDLPFDPYRAGLYDAAELYGTGATGPAPTPHLRLVQVGPGADADRTSWPRPCTTTRSPTRWTTPPPTSIRGRWSG